MRDYRAEHARRRAERYGTSAPFVRVGRATPGASEICGECGCRLPWHALDCGRWSDGPRSQAVSGA